MIPAEHLGDDQLIAVVHLRTKMLADVLRAPVGVQKPHRIEPWILNIRILVHLRQELNASLAVVRFLFVQIPSNQIDGPSIPLLCISRRMWIIARPNSV